MRYYNPITDKSGNIHSLDMVYIEYFSYLNPDVLIEKLREFHEANPDILYSEYLNMSYNSKYDYYHDYIKFSGVTIYAGKYSNYDKMTKTFDLIPMFQIRFNPNKYMHEKWFNDLVSFLLSNGSSGYLRKYDYAVDIPKEPKYVEVIGSRKEPGLFKGTRYFGQSGRHGYCKVYDKQEDMKRQNVEIGSLTRVEHTMMGNKPFSLEPVYLVDFRGQKHDLSDLNDTDRAIVEMYLRLKLSGDDYELKLGRRKLLKLKEYISGQYVPLEYGDILPSLLENIKVIFKLTDIVTDDDGFMQLSGDVDLPFE